MEVNKVRVLAIELDYWKRDSDVTGFREEKLKLNIQ